MYAGDALSFSVPRCRDDKESTPTVMLCRLKTGRRNNKTKPHDLYGGTKLEGILMMD